MKKFLIPSLLLFISGSLLFAGTPKTITIENQLDIPVYYLYISPIDVKDWGIDRLGDDILEPGASIEVEVNIDETQSVYNLMAEDESEKTYRIENLNLIEMDSITINDEDLLPPGGFNPVLRDLSFTNSTGEDIYYLYISSADSMYWGEDLLGDEILYDGTTVTLEIPIDGDYPVNDLLAEGESGSSYEISGENMLEVDEFIITEMEMTSSGDEYDEYDGYDDYDYDSYDDYSGGDDDYLEGYKEGFRDAWKEAYSLGFQDGKDL